MRKRAEQVEETRQRIVDATMHLHTTVGPSKTTIQAIAEQAGVTRLTVYRHFPDQESLFRACGQQWERQHPAPDSSAWSDITDIAVRARHGLGELYGWYQDNGDELLPLYRDAEAMPEAMRRAMRDEFQRYAEALVTGSGARGDARRRLRAACGHAVSIWTWHSLCAEQGLDHKEAADLVAALLVAAAGRGHRLTSPPTAQGASAAPAGTRAEPV